MGGWILIRDNPYFGISNPKGELTIPHIRDGKHTFVVWHERCQFVPSGTLGGKMQEFKKGQLEVKIAGDTDLGEMTIPASVLVK